MPEPEQRRHAVSTNVSRWISVPVALVAEHKNSGSLTVLKSGAEMQAMDLLFS
jgi:hypothetical protein